MKKETILKSVILAFMAMSATNVCGQTTWVYSYDNTGNRTQRVVNTGAKVRQKADSPNNLLGEVYNGEMCCDYVEKCALEGVAIAFNPKHKHAVAFGRNGEDDHEDHYDYKLLEGLMERWRESYYPWHYTTKHIHKSPDEFPGLKDDEYCPCSSGEKYKNCCKNDPEGVKYVVMSLDRELVEGISPGPGTSDMFLTK